MDSTGLFQPLKNTEPAAHASTAIPTEQVIPDLKPGEAWVTLKSPSGDKNVRTKAGSYVFQCDDGQHRLFNIPEGICELDMATKEGKIITRKERRDYLSQFKPKKRF